MSFLFPVLACVFAGLSGFAAGVLFARRKARQDMSGNDPSLSQAIVAFETTNLELREVVEALEQAAGTDRLTGAWNRRRFEEAAHSEMSLALRRGTPASLLMIDLDHFKRVNDTLGHEAGDAVLVGATNAIRSQLRGSDKLVRWGGEEFIVLSPASRLEGAQLLAEKLLKAIADLHFPGLGTITVSIGVAELRAGENLSQWIARADRAVYAAKEAGRNRVVLDSERLTRADTPEPFILEILWDDRFLCGHTLIDEQHHKLVSLANGLLTGLTSKLPAEELTLRMKRICAHAAQHFMDEERILRSIGANGVEAHAGRHRELLEKARQLQSESEKGTFDLGRVATFLSLDLVLGHIVEEGIDFIARSEASAVGG